MNLYKVREARDEGGELFRSVQKQKDQYQGIWVVSPEGKVLAGHHEIKSHETWTREVLDTLDAGLKAFGPVSPRRASRVEPLPHRGLGVLPDGGITLAIEVRYLFNGKPEGDGVIDSLTLPETDWAGLVPPARSEGTRWSVPGRTARQFCRLLSPGSDQSTMPRPEEVTSLRLIGKVESVKQGVARLVYEGSLASAHTYEKKVSKGEARLTGLGALDVKSGRLLSFQMVSDGTYRMAPPYDQELRTIGGLVEWRREKNPSPP
ncbi:MAG: hypothetical protein NVSMB9_28390 [Isosphaeraceae bacterium]